MQTQLELVLKPKTPQHLEQNRDIPLRELPTEELRELCYLPKNGKWPAGTDPAVQIKKWMNANQEAYRRINDIEIQEFRSKGSAQTWFSQWTPQGKDLKELAQAMEAALDVISQCYPSIEKRGTNHSEDIGLLQCDRQAKSEGVRVKKEPYSESLLIQVCCVTGPTNFDPSTGEIEFEPGAKSHILMLAYEKLPSLADLEADICTLPLIRDPSNALTRKGKSRTYRSEGFTSSKLYREGVKLHNPWNHLQKQEQEALIQKITL